MLQNNLLYCTWFLLKTALKSEKKLVVASIAVFGEAVGLKNVKLYHLLGNLQNRDAPVLTGSIIKQLVFMTAFMLHIFWKMKY